MPQIQVRNVYYMLSYAFGVLREQNYRTIATEKFENVAELCAAIIIKGVNSLLKRGLGRGYTGLTEPLNMLRGKPEISESVKRQTVIRRQLVCSFDEFSVNIELNRIIKSTALLLLHSDISLSRKKELRTLLGFFSEVDEIDLKTVSWKQDYNRNNATYRMVISVCNLVYKGLLQTEQDGTVKLMHYLDDKRMHKLYERFILEYYRKEHPELTANSPCIPWQLDTDNDFMLPRMQSDIVLEKGSNILIIDAKYYTQITQSLYGTETVRSAHLYQIFTYVKNKQYETQGSVSGLLLYARTDEDLNTEYSMSGNRIGVRTLDLNADFGQIRAQLDSIADML